MRARLPLFVAVGIAPILACDSPHDAAPRPSSESVTSASLQAPAPKPEIAKAPPGLGDGRAWVLGEMERAEREQRKLVIYVGASWCEPCVRFHDAVLAGQLDRELAGVRFLELDADAHERIRGEADLGCASRMIPLFARPTAEGRCGVARVEGAIKGDGAVGFILPRLLELLRD